MDTNIALQISDLINRRNELVIAYDAKMILDSGENYLYEIKGEKLIAYVEVKKVQWYQWEISHLSVDENFERQGFGRQLVARAEEKAKNGGAKILQCTIRVDNEGSKHVFSICDFVQVGRFYNSNTGNDVEVWQKVISLQQ